MHARYDNLIWMKLSEIARYWAARELTEVSRQGRQITLRAPFATPRFTVRIPGKPAQPPRIETTGIATTPNEVTDPLRLQPNTWHQTDTATTLCFNLPKGQTTIAI